MRERFSNPEACLSKPRLNLRDMYADLGATEIAHGSTGPPAILDGDLIEAAAGLVRAVEVVVVGEPGLLCRPDEGAGQDRRVSTD